MKLPVFRILAAAYGAVAGNLGRFLLATVPALVIIVALWLLRLGWDGESGWFFVLWPFIDILPYIFFGLIWFRLCETEESFFPQPLFGPRSTVYFTLAIFAFLLIWLPTLFFALPLLFGILETARTGARLSLFLLLQGVVLLPGLLLIWLYLLGRFSLLLPAAALDESLGFRSAWRATAGNGLRLLGAYLLAGLPALFFAAVLAAFAIGQGHWGGSGAAHGALESHAVERALTGLAIALFRLAAVALLATVAAEIFRRLVQRQRRHPV